MQLSEDVQSAFGDSVRVEQAFLPMILIGGVRVVVGTRVGLSTMERFALEVLTALGPSDPHVLEELVAIPPRVALWLLGSLAQKGMAEEGQAGIFEIREENASVALAAGAAVSEREELADVLWFPQSGEAIAFASGSVEVRTVGELTPVGHWPLSPEESGAEVSKLLSSVLASKRLYGPLAGAIDRFENCGTLDHESCPGYVCSASALSTNPNEPWKISIRVRGVRRGKGAANVARELSFCLPHAEAGWRAALDEVEAELYHRLVDRWGFDALDGEILRMRASIRATALRELAQDRLARRTISLRVELGDELIFRLPVLIEPADDDANELLAFDEEVCEQIFGDVDQQGISENQRRRVYERLWQLGLFESLYGLRERDDFFS